MWGPAGRSTSRQAASCTRRRWPTARAAARSTCTSCCPQLRSTGPRALTCARASRSTPAPSTCTPGRRAAASPTRPRPCRRSWRSRSEAASDMYSHAVADGTAGGGIAVTVMIPDAEANGKTLAYAGDGTNVDAGALNITADGKVKGEASNVSLTVGALGGQGSIPTANVGSATDAYVGKNADASLNMVKVKIGVKGPITLNATSDNTASAHTDGGSGGLATIGVMFPTS